MSRLKPRNRRATETLTFTFMSATYHVSFGRAPNGNISEIFVVAGKVGSAVEAMARDLGIAVSIMLQSGILLTDIERSLTHNEDGTSAGPLGEIIKQMKAVW